MSRFDDFDRMVLEFMREFGFIATYVRTLSAVPNDTTGDVDIITEDIEVQAIKMELFQPTSGSYTSKPGTEIMQGDQILYVRPVEKSDKFAEAITLDPTTDKVLINGGLWSIVSVKEYTPDAVNNILYELYIRK